MAFISLLAIMSTNAHGWTMKMIFKKNFNDFSLNDSEDMQFEDLKVTKIGEILDESDSLTTLKPQQGCHNIDYRPDPNLLAGSETCSYYQPVLNPDQTPFDRYMDIMTHKYSNLKILKVGTRKRDFASDILRTLSMCQERKIIYVNMIHITSLPIIKLSWTRLAKFCALILLWLLPSWRSMKMQLDKVLNPNPTMSLLALLNCAQTRLFCIVWGRYWSRLENWTFMIWIELVFDLAGIQRAINHWIRCQKRFHGSRTSYLSVDASGTFVYGFRPHSQHYPEGFTQLQSQKICVVINPSSVSQSQSATEFIRLLRSQGAHMSQLLLWLKPRRWTELMRLSLPLS